MAAQTFVLTTTPTLIADGTKAGTRFTQSDTSPNTSTTPYCTIIKNDLSISAGFKLWAWSPTASNITVTVLTSEY